MHGCRSWRIILSHAVPSLCDSLVSARQEAGPYALWQHHHAFTATEGAGGGGTLCSDVVR